MDIPGTFLFLTYINHKADTFGSLTRPIDTITTEIPEVLGLCVHNS